MKYILLIILSIIPLVSRCQNKYDFIQKVRNYQDSVKLNHVGEFDILDPNTFDINTYLSFFDKLEVEKGFSINVFFFDNFLDGNPYLYVLKGNEEIIYNKNKESLYKALNKLEYRAKNHVIPSDSEIGFLQYLFFSEMGEQFALKWHSYYNEKFILCTKEKLDVVVNELRKYNQPQTEGVEDEMPLFGVDLQELDKIAHVNPAIEIEMSNTKCEITWIEDRTHRGIYKCKYSIQRQFPFKIEKIREECLLKISLGFSY